MKKILATPLIVAMGASISMADVLPPITSDGADQEIYSDGTSKWVGQSTGRIGTGGPGLIDATMVYVFQLPTIAAGQSVSEATLSFDITAINSFNPGDLVDLDIYGVRSDSASTVDAVNDYRSAGSTLLEASVLNQNSALGVHSTTAATVFGTWIQSLYDGGAVAGDYAFVSLQTVTVNALTARYYTVGTATGAVTPTLNLTTAIPEPATIGLVAAISGAMLFIRRRFMI